MKSFSEYSDKRLFGAVPYKYSFIMTYVKIQWKDSPWSKFILKGVLQDICFVVYVDVKRIKVVLHFISISMYQYLFEYSF